MSSSTTASLDSMPTEIKLKILKNIPNTKTLYSLIRASPTIYAFYRSAREELLTQITVNELPHDMIETFQIAALLDITCKDPETERSLTFKSALRSLCIQLCMNQTPLIPVDECQRLKGLVYVVGWKRAADDTVLSLRRQGPNKDSQYWTDRIVYQRVYIGQGSGRSGSPKKSFLLVPMRDFGERYRDERY